MSNSRVPLQRVQLLHYVAYGTAVNERKQGYAFKLTKDTTQYLALTGELLGVYCEICLEKLPCYNNTASYFIFTIPVPKNGTKY